MLADKVRVFLEISAPQLYQQFEGENSLAGISETFNELAIVYLSTLDDNYPILTSEISAKELQRWGPFWELTGPYICADTKDFIISLALRTTNGFYLHACYVPRTKIYIQHSN